MLKTQVHVENFITFRMKKLHLANRKRKEDPLYRNLLSTFIFKNIIYNNMIY